MKITNLLSKSTIDIQAVATSKQDIIEQAVKLISKSGAIKDIETYKAGVFKREEESTTGIGEGIAIPHCKSSSVTKPALCAMVIKDGVDFDSLDGEKVNLLFLIAAPDSEDNVHLEVLARLSNLLMDENFKNNLLNAKTKQEFLKIIDDAEQEKIQKEETTSQEEFPEILAVTACPTGIAHTYMAEEALKKAGEKLGVSIKVETNGSGGAKNILTKEEIEHCKGIIVAADVNVEMDRFNGKKVVQVAVAKGIHEPEALINKVLDDSAPVYTSSNASKEQSSNDNGSIFHQIYKHLMSGVSHMLPLVIGGGILIALAFLVDTIYCNATGTPIDGSFGTMTAFSSWVKTLGGAAFGFMLPIFAAFIAYSIAGRPGLAVGFVGGWTTTVSSFSIKDTGSTSGFLGALFAGFIAGYIVKGLMYITRKLPKSLDGIRPTFIYPLFGIAAIGLAMYILNTPFSYINKGIYELLIKMHEANLTILLGAILAGMMAADMGGPINKASYVFGSTFCLSQASTLGFTTPEAAPFIQLMAAVMIGGMVPHLGIALATNLFPQRFSKADRDGAKVNYLMGAAFITEGAIPYAAADPLRVIPSCIAGSAIAGFLSVLCGCTLMAPHGGVFVFAVVGNWYFYILALVVGSLVTAFLLGLLKKDHENPELGKFKGISLKRKGK